MVVSRLNPDTLWVHNDSGDSARLFALSLTGAHKRSFSLPTSKHVDWVDISLGPGPG
jgi:hypothetical protein